MSGGLQPAQHFPALTCPQRYYKRCSKIEKELPDRFARRAPFEGRSGAPFVLTEILPETGYEKPHSDGDAGHSQSNTLDGMVTPTIREPFAKR